MQIHLYGEIFYSGIPEHFLSVLSERPEAASAKHGHNTAHGQTHACSSGERSLVLGTHILIPGAPEFQILQELAVFHVAGLHLHSLSRVLHGLHIVAGSLVRRRRKIIPARAPLVRRHPVQNI